MSHQYRPEVAQASIHPNVSGLIELAGAAAASSVAELDFSFPAQLAVIVVAGSLTIDALRRLFK